MDIKDLRDGMRRVDAEGEIIEISDPRSVNLRTGDQARVADCTLKDETGQIKLSLWDDQIDQVKRGSKVRITNGYTNSFRGEVRLNVGRYGKLEVVEGIE
jgi:replication factor A1